ncbi:hypothetical protein V8D89_006750 [Ganoderma adspersum]
MPLAFRPHDPYHEYAAEEWDSTDIESDSPKSLVEEGKRRGTILSKHPPTTEVVQDSALLQEFVTRLYVLRLELHQELQSPSPSSPQPPTPLSLHVTPSLTAAPLSDAPPSPTTSAPLIQFVSLVHPPASSGPSSYVSPVAHRGGSKRVRKEDSESSSSDSGLPPQNKRAKRRVLQPISNSRTIPSSSVLVPRKSRALEATTNPAPDTPLLTAPPKQQRRTIQDLQNAVEGKAGLATDNSHICQIGGCKEPLLFSKLKEARDHIKEHYKKAGPQKGFVCLRPGCSSMCGCISSATRHFESHLPWVFPCPNAARGCRQGPFHRADLQTKHQRMCRFTNHNASAIQSPDPTVDEGYSADNELQD